MYMYMYYCLSRCWYLMYAKDLCLALVLARVGRPQQWRHKKQLLSVPPLQMSLLVQCQREFGAGTLNRFEVEDEVAAAVVALHFAWEVFDLSALLVLEKCGAEDIAVPIHSGSSCVV